MTGMPFWDAYRQALYNANRNAARKARRVDKAASVRNAIRRRWGMEWHQLLAMLHAQGLSRAECAQAMGYQSRHSLYCALQRSPEHDPWTEHRTIPAQYLIDTGESFPNAVRRMQAEGMTLGEATTAVGYAPKAYKAMLYAMAQYGIENTFVKRRKAYRPITIEYARKLELLAGAPKVVRTKRKRPAASNEPHPWKVEIAASLASHNQKQGCKCSS